MSENFWIRASEVQSYVYCARSWWLQDVLGLEPEDVEGLIAGADRHLYDGRRVVRSEWMGRLGLAVLVLALLLVVLAWQLRGG